MQAPQTDPLLSLEGCLTKLTAVVAKAEVLVEDATSQGNIASRAVSLSALKGTLVDTAKLLAVLAPSSLPVPLAEPIDRKAVRAALAGIATGATRRACWMASFRDRPQRRDSNPYAAARPRSGALRGLRQARARGKRLLLDELVCVVDPVAWGRARAGFQLDPWQCAFLRAKGNTAVVAGERVGKTAVVALKAAHHIAVARTLDVAERTRRW